MTNFDPPSDPFYEPRDCPGCGQSLHKEWSMAGDSDFICINPECPNSSRYIDHSDDIYCRVCEDWIKRSELKRWTGDDAVHHLCPGCDSDLLLVKSAEA
jgi:hypothetical protein